MTKKGETVEELMARLEADPEFVARREKKEAERIAREAELRRAEAPLLDDLARVGHPVATVWDLANSGTTYPAALPVLLDHVTRPYPGPVKDGIARSLGVPEGSFGWSTLVRVYREEHDARAKAGLAAALAAIAGTDRLDELIELARDPAHGTSRVLLLGALQRSSDPRAKAALMELGSDPELHQQVQIILRKKQRRTKGR